MATHVFRPYVFVNDAGAISFDWDDCFVYSVDKDGWSRTEEASEATDRAASKLDHFVAHRNLNGFVHHEEG